MCRFGHDTVSVCFSCGISDGYLLVWKDLLLSQKKRVLYYLDCPKQEYDAADPRDRVSGMGTQYT